MNLEELQQIAMDIKRSRLEAIEVIDHGDFYDVFVPEMGAVTVNQTRFGLTCEAHPMRKDCRHVKAVQRHLDNVKPDGRIYCFVYGCENEVEHKMLILDTDPPLNYWLCQDDYDRRDLPFYGRGEPSE